MYSSYSCQRSLTSPPKQHMHIHLNLLQLELFLHNFPYIPFLYFWLLDIHTTCYVPGCSISVLGFLALPSTRYRTWSTCLVLKCAVYIKWLIWRLRVTHSIKNKGCSLFLLTLSTLQAALPRRRTFLSYHNLQTENWNLVITWPLVAHVYLFNKPEKQLSTCCSTYDVFCHIQFKGSYFQTKLYL